MDVIITSKLACLVQIGARDIDDLLIWTIYRHPRDYPGKYIARPFSARALDGLDHTGAPKGKAVILADDTLQGLRDQLPYGLVLLPRQRTDETQIVESWI